MGCAPSWMTPEKVDDAPWLVRTAAFAPLFVMTPASEDGPPARLKAS